MSFQPRLLVACALVITVLIGSACGRSEPGESQPTPTDAAPSTPRPTPTPTPVPFDIEATLEQSGQVTQGLGSFSFRLRHERGSIQLAGFNIDNAEGDVLNPDKISVAFSGLYGSGFAFRASLITISDSSYMTNPLTGKWEALAANVSPLGFFNPSRGIGAMLSQVAQVQLVQLVQGAGPGTDAYRLAGNLAAESLEPLVGTTLKDATVHVELTSDADNLDLLESRITGRVTPTDTDDVVRVITLSAFNKPFTIEPPL